MQPQALPGFRDFYPADFALRDHIFRTWRSVAARYGFEEYDGPPLEPLELYTAKSGEEIVGQLYSFTDKGEREVSLRPEMTPTLARMVAARASAFRKPIRWFSIPQLFRYERQQRGRLREHFQLNCDLIGESSHLADAEIVALAIDALRAFGLGSTDFRVRLSDRRLLTAVLRALELSEAQVPVVYQVFDKLRRTKEETSVERLAAAGIPKPTIDRLLGLARAKVVGGAARRSAPGWTPHWRRASRCGAPSMRSARWASASISISTWGSSADSRTTPGRSSSCSTPRASCAPSAAAAATTTCSSRSAGWISRRSASAWATWCWASCCGTAGWRRQRRRASTSSSRRSPRRISPELLGLARELRDAGFRVEYALSPQAVGKQLKLADARNARAAIVIGPDDRARGEVMLKDLRGKGQTGVPRGSVRER